MKTKNIYQIITILSILIVSSFQCYSQFKADVDGTMEVSPVNGDLSYVYPISRNTIDGYPISVNLNYVSNLMFVELYDYFKDDTTNGWSKFTRIHPGWILGVNGFAIQVLGFKHRFVSWKNTNWEIYKIDTLGNGNKDTIWNLAEILNPPQYKDENDFTWLIDGYDFCNRMKSLNNPGDQDIIRILKSDGSVLELLNPTIKENRDINDTSLYTGTYYENGINTKGYAIVSFDSTYWTSYFKQFANGKLDSVSYIPRKLKYYDGDGLEYVFIEHPAPYGRRAFKGIWEEVGNREFATPSTKSNICPTIFYLEQINSSMGKITDFKRDYHYPKEDTIDVHRGRANVTNFTGHTITYGDREMTIEALGRTIKLKLTPKHSGRDNYLNEWCVPTNCQEFQEWNGSDDSIIYYTHYNFTNYPFNLLEEELKTYISYWGINSLDLISEIKDPENRSTKFNYECFSRYHSGFASPFNNVNLFYLRLDTIQEPKKMYTINYCQGNGVIEKDTLLNESSFLDYDMMNVVSIIKKYDYINKRQGELLQEQDYRFNVLPNDSNQFRNTVIDAYDYAIDSNGIYPGSGYYNFNEKIYYFKKYSTTPFIYDSAQSYLTPNVQTVVPYKIITKDYTDLDYPHINTTVQTMNYQSMDGISSKFDYLPIETETRFYQTGNNDTITTSHMTYQYEFGDLQKFQDADLINAYGKGITKSTTNILRPDNDSDTLYKKIDEFINLPLVIGSGTRTDSIWNWGLSRRLTDSLRLQSIDTTVVIYTTSQSVPIAPPLWQLPSNEYIEDGKGNILSGKINNYEMNYITQNPPHRRGALISDFIVGKNDSTMLNSLYKYTGGWYRNFLSSSQNSVGATSRMYYNYFKVPALGSSYPTGKKLMNNNDVEIKKMFHIQNEIEAPLVSEQYVRKYGNNGGAIGPFTDTLRTIFEKTYFGQDGRTIDPNGWIYASLYDLNGRTKKVWHPFDFPPQESCDPFNANNNNNKLLLFDILTRYDTLRIAPTGCDTCPIGGGVSTKPTPAIGKEVSDSLVITKRTIIIYHCSFDDMLHQCNNLDTAFLRVFLLGYDLNECITLNVKSGRFGLDKNFVLGCPALQLLPNAPVPVTEGGKLPELRVDLMPIIDSLKRMGQGDTVSFMFTNLSLSGGLSIINSSDDLNPVISVYCDTKCTNDDYTFAYEYDDSARTTTYSSKIDDALHTFNYNWDKTYTNFDGRYTGSIGYFKEENLKYRTFNLIGNPTSPIRIDSVSVKYSGAGLALNGVDQELNQTESVWRNNELIKTIHSDATQINIQHRIDAPANLLDLTGNNYQDFYGVCKATIMTDELGKRNASYTDAFGNLRRTIVDLDTLNLMTKYEYDISGNLRYVINPANDTTKYWYDIFNRLKYKYQSDINYVSYTYNKLGQLRFSQNKLQADSNRVSVFEYDDLGRTTVIAEAKINPLGLQLHEPLIYSDTSWSFGRLTEVLKPDTMNNIPLGQALPPTINITLYLQPTHSSTFSQYPYVASTDCLFGGFDYPGDNNPVPPYFWHPAYNWEPKDTTANTNDFENFVAYPQFIRTVINYDETPSRIGNVWSNLPQDSVWNKMAPYGKLHNLKGRQVAVAYRDHGGEPYHYVVFSYDPRGRIEALLRYNENLIF
ncbi:MAG: hypothetical protein ABSG15_06975, partial [FCB group bacterium]